MELQNYFFLCEIIKSTHIHTLDQRRLLLSIAIYFYRDSAYSHKYSMRSVYKFKTWGILQCSLWKRGFKKDSICIFICDHQNLIDWTRKNYPTWFLIYIIKYLMKKLISDWIVVDFVKLSDGSLKIIIQCYYHQK